MQEHSVYQQKEETEQQLSNHRFVVPLAGGVEKLIWFALRSV